MQVVAFILRVLPTYLLRVSPVRPETVDVNISVAFLLYCVRCAHLDFSADGVRMRMTDNPVLDTGHFLTIVRASLAQKSTFPAFSRFLDWSFFA